MVSAGGFVAVNVFGNRSSTEDVNYILDPYIKNPTKAEEKLRTAIQTVTRQLELENKWINDSMSVYAAAKKGRTLFRESIEQNEVLFHGTYLVIYAAKWQWALARKLIRISGQGDRGEGIDRSDSVELIRQIIGPKGKPLHRDVMKGWMDNIYTPIRDDVLDQVAADYETKYGTQDVV